MLIPAPSLVELAWWLVVPSSLFIALGWLIHRRGFSLPPWLEAALSSALAACFVGVFSAGILLFVWRSPNEPQPVHDEQAYVLQAQILARGQWTGERPPIPEFFEQTHVFVEPRLASKYPPGNSLLLVPGIWLGLPGLMPLLFTAVAGGLVFAISRRLIDPSAALLTWALWATSTIGLHWRASYYSQNLDAALWLFSLWALLRWNAEAKQSRLIVIGCVYAWMYLTRPLTALALGAPVAIVVLVVMWRRRLFKQVGIALVVACPVMLLNPIWHQETMGNWRTNPYSEYSRQYMPFDRPGFGVDLAPPLKPATPPHQWIEQEFVPYHAQHQLSTLPVIVTARIVVLMRALGEHWRIGLVVFFVVGAISARGTTAFGVIAAVCLVLAYLLYAHPAWWTVYYTEAFPVFFLVAVSALMRFAKAVVKLDERGLRATAFLSLMLAVPWLAADVVRARGQSDARNGFHRQARNVLSTLPPQPAIVFVQYPPHHLHYLSLVVNSPDYRTAPVWLVYDRGADNERLLRLSDRAAFRLYTETWKLERVR